MDGHQKLSLFLMAYVIMLFTLVYLEVGPEIIVEIIFGTVGLVLIVSGFYAIFGQGDKQYSLLAHIHSCGNSATAKELLEPYKEEFVRQFLIICALWRLEDRGLVERRKNQYELTPKGLAKLESLEVESSIS